MDDRGLDDRLREVSLPTGLAGRVVTGAFDDSSLDRALRRVAVPDGLGSRIAAAPRQRVAPPARPARRRASRALASVARDLLAVTAALAAIGLVAAGSARLSRTLSTPRRAAVAVRTPAAPRPGATPRAVPADPRREPPHVAARAGEPPRAASETPAPIVPAMEAVADVDRPARPTAAAPQVRGAAVGLQPELVSWPRPAPRTPRDAWRRVPRSSGYDLLFELSHGEPPFVDPRSDGLRTDVPPLTVQTESFDRWVAAEPRGRRLRTEHVLAAIAPPPVGQASAAGPVTVAMHAVRSLRNSNGRPSLIVEVAATAGGFADRDEHWSGINATIVLDRAAGGEPLAWRWACRAVAAVADRMHPDDRVTLVVAGPVPRIAARDAAGPELARIAADLADLSPSESSDLDAALAVARKASARDTRTVVVVQDDVGDASGGETRSALGRWQERAAGGAESSWSSEALPDFVVIDAAAEFEPSRPAVAFGRTAADAVAIRRALLARVFGRDTLVAGRGRLTVDFDPATVAAYRLIGHHQSAVESLSAGAPATIDLHVGETARVVYEVVPRSSADVKAAAVFQWASADGSRDARARLRAGADATAGTPSAHGCELLLAVALGEEQAGSPHALPRSRAADLVGRWRARGDVTPLGAVLADALVSASRRTPVNRDP